MVKDVLQDVKCSLIRVPFFFVQTILIIGMHNFFNMHLVEVKGTLNVYWVKRRLV